MFTGHLAPCAKSDFDLNSAKQIATAGAEPRARFYVGNCMGDTLIVDRNSARRTTSFGRLSVFSRDSHRREYTIADAQVICDWLNTSPTFAGRRAS